MRDVYGCRLPLLGTGTTSFERALQVVRAEVTGALGLDPTALDADQGSLTPRPGVVLRWHLLTAPGVDERMWTLRWQRPHDGDPDVAGHLSVNVGLEYDAAWVIVRLALRPMRRRVLPVRFDVRPPEVVRAVVANLEVAEDGRRLSGKATVVSDHDGVRSLLELVTDPDRVLPVVVATPAETVDEEAGSSRVAPLVDADEVAGALVGLAHVVVPETMELAELLDGALGPGRSVSDGGVRLFWPELDGEDRPHHPLWSPDQLADPRNQPFASVVLRRVASAALFQVHAGGLEARMRAAMERHGHEEIARLSALVEEARIAPEWQEELERAWSELDRLREENADLARRLAIANENLRAMSAHRHPSVRDDDGETIGAEERPLTTVTQAVERARTECDRLVFLDECFESARRATYRQPRRVYDALTAMNEVAGEWARGELSSGFRDAFSKRGFEFAAQMSPTTRGKYGHEYERTYKGRTILLRPHLSLGRGSPVACCRIYFHLDEDERLFVVGHVGNHLSTG